MKGMMMLCILTSLKAQWNRTRGRNTMLLSLDTVYDMESMLISTSQPNGSQKMFMKWF